MKHSLRNKQIQFCVEYLVDFNATAAAVRSGYSKNSAAEIGHENLKKPQIQAYLSKLRDETARTSAVTLERTLEEVAYIAFSRLNDSLSFNDRGLTLKPSEDLDDSVLAAIAQVQIIETESEAGSKVTKTIKLHNKMSALNWLGQFFGIGTDFNQARASLKRYGLALEPDPGSEVGWRLERHCN